MVQAHVYRKQRGWTMAQAMQASWMWNRLQAAETSNEVKAVHSSSTYSWLKTLFLPWVSKQIGLFEWEAAQEIDNVLAPINANYKPGDGARTTPKSALLHQTSKGYRGLSTR